MSRELDAACARVAGLYLIPKDEHAFVRLLEDEIERRGRDLWIEYVHNLKSEVYGDDPVYEEWAIMVWSIIRATPEQRARAFLTTLDNPT